MMSAFRETWAKMSRRDELLLPLILIAAFVLRVHVLHLPGPNPDELLYAVEGERLRAGDPTWAVSVPVAGHRLPVGLDGYQGGFPIYVHCFVSLLTEYPLRFRLIDILYDLGLIAIAYWFAEKTCSRRAAVLSALFLATMPTMVFFSRIGEMAIFLRILLANLALYCFYRWGRDERWDLFYTGMLALGLGISTRLEIAWWPISVGAYLLLLNRPLLKHVAILLWNSKRRTVTGLACFALGAGLWIAYNVQTDWGTFRQIASNAGETYTGHNNLHVFSNFKTRVGHLRQTLEGDGIWGLNAPWRNRFFAVTFALAFLTALGASVIARWKRRPDHMTEWMLFMLMFTLGLSTFSVSELAIMHILLIMPLPVLIMSRMLDRIPYQCIVVVVAVALVVSNLIVDAADYQRLRQTRGAGHFSPRIYDMPQELRRFGVSKVVACDWGLARSVYYFSEGRVKVQEIFGYTKEAPPSFFTQLAGTLREPGVGFLFCAPAFTTFPRQQAFLAYLKEHGTSADEHVIEDDYGPIYLLYKVAKNQDPADANTAAIRAAARPSP